MPIFMKFDGIDGEVVEAARAPTADVFLFASSTSGDDVVVDGHIITAENYPASASPEGRPGENLSLNFEEIKIEMAASRDSAAAEQDRLVAGVADAAEKDHDKWTELTSFSNGGHKAGGGAAWDGGEPGLVGSELDLF